MKTRHEQPAHNPTTHTLRGIILLSLGVTLCTACIATLAGCAQIRQLASNFPASLQNLFCEATKEKPKETPQAETPHQAPREANPVELPIGPMPADSPPIADDGFIPRD